MNKRLAAFLVFLLTLLMLIVNTSIAQTTPTFTAVSAGEAHVCALASDGSVQCWGNNTNSRATPPSGITFKSVSAGAQTTCGIVNTPAADVNELNCWGNSASSVTAALTSTYSALSVGDQRSGSNGARVCAITGTALACKDTGTVATGTIVSVSLGLGNQYACAITTSATDNLSCWGANTQDTKPVATNYSQVSVGYDFSCAIKTDNKVNCWGTKPAGTPADASFPDLKQIAVGSDHVCGIKMDNTVECWGTSTLGKLTVPSNGATPYTFSQIDAGQNFTCGITTTGEMRCWGENVVALSASTATIAENGGASGITATMGYNVSANTTVNLASAGGTTVAADYTLPTITIPNGGSSNPAVANVLGVTDEIIEGSETLLLTTAATHIPAVYSPITITITDDDTAIGVSSTTISATEGGATGTYDLTIPAGKTFQTGHAAVINVASSDPSQCTVSPSQVTLNTGTRTGTVTVTAVNDTIVEGDHTCTVTNTIAGTSSTPWLTPSVTMSSVTVNITDNDNGIAPTPTTLSVTEGAADGSYTIAFANAPQTGQQAVIQVNADANGQCLVYINADTPAASTTVTLTGAAQSKQVFVRAVDDSVVEDKVTHPTCTITHALITGTTAHYTGVTVANVVATIPDNDNPTINITQSGGTTQINEKPTPVDGVDTDTYTVQLGAAPAGTVNINITTDGQCTVLPTSLALTSGTMSGTVTITATDDATMEGTHDCVITHAVAGGSDALWTSAVWNPQNTLTATIIDNDGGIDVSVASGTLNEGSVGTTVTYTLKFASPTPDPIPVVKINILPQAGQCTVTPASPITLTAAVHTMTVQVTPDTVVEGAHSCVINHEITSDSDAVWKTIQVASVEVAITDDDAAQVNLSTTTLNVTENASNTYTVSLSNTPKAGDSVKVNINPGPECSVNGGAADAQQQITLTTTTPQTVTIAAANNDLIDGSRVCIVTHTIDNTSSPLWQNPSYSADLTVTVSDNDTPGLTLTPNGTQFTEGGSETYTLNFTGNLRPKAGDNIEVDITITGECTVNGVGTSTSATLNSSTPGGGLVLTVAAANNLIVEGNRNCTISHAVDDANSSSLWHSVNSITGNPIVMTVVDDDLPSITVTAPNPLNVTEGETRSYTIALDTTPKPGDVVSINITVVPNASDIQCNPSSTSVTLDANTTSANIVITATDDEFIDSFIEDCSFQHSLGAGTSAVWNVAIGGTPNFTVDVIEDDVLRTISVTEAGGTNITEGGATDTYTLRMETRFKPTGDPQTDQYLNLALVQISVAPVDQCTVSISGGAGSPAAEQVYLWDDQPSFREATVTVTATNDNIVEGTPHNCTLSHTVITNAFSNTNLWVGTSIADVAAAITDDDNASVNISPITRSLTEGVSTTNYAISLPKMPKAGDSVSITIATDGKCLANGLTNTSVTLTSMAASIITVSVTNDTVVDGTRTCIITHSVNNGSTSALWDDAPINSSNQVTVTITDDDKPGITISPTSITVAEGGSNTYNITLNKLPRAGNNVIVTLTPDANCNVGSGMGVARDVLLNTTSPSVVTVLVTDNDVVDGTRSCIITHVVKTAGTDDLWFPPNQDPALSLPNVTVTITDDDAPTVTVNPTALSLAEGASGNYNLSLDKTPSSAVQITVDPAAGCDVGAGNGVAIVEDFTVKDTPTQITVTAVQDVIVEGSHNCVVTHTVTGGDPAWQPPTVTIASVTVTITDDDNPDIDVSKSTTTIAEGANDTYTITLATLPLTDVIISISADAQCSVAPTTLILNASNASDPVTITATQDLVVEGNHACTINHAILASQGATTTDSLWLSASVASINVTITDDDIPGVSVSADLSSIVTEGDFTDYSFSLSGIPQDGSNIVITVTPNAQCSIGLPPDTLGGFGPGDISNFTLNNSQPSQTVRVFAWNDNIKEGNQTCDITHSINVSLTAALWQTAPVANAQISVTFSDNDSATVSVSPLLPYEPWNPPATRELSEEFPEDDYTYFIRLSSAPQSNLTVVATFLQDTSWFFDHTANECKFVGAGASEEDGGKTYTLTFTPLGSLQGMINVAPVDDTIDDEWRNYCYIQHTVQYTPLGDDHDWTGTPVDNQTIWVEDNDSNLIVPWPSAELLLTEGTIEFDDYYYLWSWVFTPVADLVITAAPQNSQCDIGAGPGKPLTVTLTSDLPYWFLEVTSPSDGIEEKPKLCVIKHTIVSGDAIFNGAIIPDVEVTVLDAPVSVIRNGSFESGILPWRVVNATKDKVMCQGAGASGNCAFRFVGVTGENAVLRQTRNLSTRSIKRYTEFTMDGWYRTTADAVPDVTLRLTVTYADGRTPSAITQTITAPIVDYTYLTMPSPIITSGSTVAKTKLQITNRTLVGQIWLDLLDVRYQRKNAALTAPRSMTILNPDTLLRQPPRQGIDAPISEESSASPQPTGSGGGFLPLPPPPSN